MKTIFEEISKEYGHPNS